MRSFKQIVTDFGWPRIIIFLFLVLLFLMPPFAKVTGIERLAGVASISIPASFSDVFNRFGQNAVFVLALVPMIQSGCGLNFGLSLGILSGLLGATLSMQFNLHGAAGFFGGLVLASPFAVLFGGAYGMLLNKVKGEEMTIAMYVGFASVFFMSIMWLLLPYTHPDMVWGFAGKGLRTTISVENYWIHILNNFLAIPGGDVTLSPMGVKTYEFLFPTGELLFVALTAFLMWLFMRTKTGTAMTAVGSNPDYARAGGISVDKMRLVSVIISTFLGAAGILVYEQSFGFIQLYTAPLAMPFSAIAAILIGGASVNKASMVNVLIGTFLFQGLLTMAPSVINSTINSDLSEVVRIIVSQGIIIYALTRKTKVTK